jgi:hypothetical protein
LRIFIIQILSIISCLSGFEMPCIEPLIIVSLSGSPGSAGSPPVMIFLPQIQIIEICN